MPPRQNSSVCLVGRCLRVGLVALVLLSGAVQAQQPVRIGIVSDGPSERSYIPLDVLRAEIAAVLGREFTAVYPPVAERHGDWQADRIRGVLQNLLADPGVDVVLTSGLIATHVAAQLETLAKPVIGIAVADVVLQKFPRAGDSSGKRNFVYLADDRTVGADLELFHRLVGYRHLVILADAAIMAALPSLPALVTEAAERLQVAISLVEVSDSANAALAAIPAAADAVFVPPLLRFSGAEVARLAELLIERRLPSFSLVSRPYLEQGILMTGAGRDVDVNRAARRIALNLQSILLGRDAGTLKVGLSQPQKLALNMRTARAIGYAPRWQDLEGAIVLHEDVGGDAEALTLVGALERALEANLALKVAEFAPLIAAAEVSDARAGLLPQVAANSSATAIDEDRANPQFQAERSATAALEASQLLYSEQVWAGYHVARYLKEAEDHGLRIAVLDTIEATARAYLNLLLAEAQAGVRRSNVKVTESNLELAQSRTRIGQSGRTDVLRFTSELAIDRQNYYTARAAADAARVELKRLLVLDQAMAVSVSDDGIAGMVDLLGDKRFQKFFDNKSRWQRFRAYAASRALNNAPELAQNNALIARSERELTATRRAYYVPDVKALGQSSQRILRGGSGSSLRGTGLDNEQWSVGIEATLPLFRGGARRAQKTRAQYELTRTRMQRAELENTIRARVLAALEQAGGSFPAIRLSRTAASAAADNLAVVTDAYSAGAASITELNDAQDAALTARLAAAQARYQFMLDFVAVQRGIADFDVLLLPQGLEQWYTDVNDYFSQTAGATP